MQQHSERADDAADQRDRAFFAGCSVRRVLLRVLAGLAVLTRLAILAVLARLAVLAGLPYWPGWPYWPYWPGCTVLGRAAATVLLGLRRSRALLRVLLRVGLFGRLLVLRVLGRRRVRRGLPRRLLARLLLPGRPRLGRLRGRDRLPWPGGCHCWSGSDPCGPLIVSPQSPCVLADSPAPTVASAQPTRRQLRRRRAERH